MVLLRFLLLPAPLALLSALLMWLTAADGFVLSYAWLPSQLQTGIGLLLMLIAASICVTAGVSLRRANTTVDPRQPDATTALVQHGIFAYSRNPIYLGFILALLGWLFIVSALMPLLWWICYFGYLDRVQIPREEQALTINFGDHFVAYCRRVRRWL
jgi:protein-S-isoprenylcysteine O-methyltransferase Ste14